VSNEILMSAAKAIATKHDLPVQDVITCCPPALVRQTGPLAIGRMCVDEMEALVDQWGDAVSEIAKSRRRVREESDLKRLKYFRRKYGPHITMEHLPRGKK
jgi:hypothetical protein